MKGNNVFEAINSLHGSERKAFLNAIKLESLTYPKHLVRVDFGRQRGLLEVWRSQQYLVQVHAHTDEIERLSINRTDLNENYSRWKDGITWDTLQRLKRECGRGDYVACEIYPPEIDIVNVANIRHLWVFKSARLDELGIVWKSAKVGS